MERIEALIFDMDGTMVDSMPWHSKAWMEFARRRNLQLDVADLMRRTTGRNAYECACELMERTVSQAESDEITHEKETIYRELFGAVFAEVAGFGAFAKAAVARGFKIAVGTAGDRHNIAFVMERLRMDPLPLAIVGGDEGFTGKPTPAIFLEAARRIGVAPERCVVFEDAPFGIEAARRGGMRAVAVCTTHSAAELAGPHLIAAVRNYNELVQSKFLETLNADA
ncbi:MAG: HAD family phosphatase [Variovorax sp.]|nr:MAG: HAD family phosphatase [Variovorax sp.]